MSEQNDRNLMHEASVHLPFKTIQNCRDLAGMKTVDNQTIKPGKLLRSAHLGRADRHDLLTLENLGISEVVDLRTDWEMVIAPDHSIPGAIHHHVEVYTEKDLSQTEGGQRKLIRSALSDSRQLMENAYRAMVSDPDSIAAWKKLFKILLEAQGGVLFHCTQGKDRTGIAALLIETALGVEKPDIINDYMQTNLYTAKEAAEDRLVVEELLKHHHTTADTDIDSYLFAHEDYLQAAAQAARQLAGSWTGYLKRVIGLQDADLTALRKKYLQ